MATPPPDADGSTLHRWAAEAEKAGDHERAKLLRAEAATRPYRTTNRRSTDK